MPVYYNEIDPYAAQWLRNLIKEGLIADGEVDTRSIVDVRPGDLVAFEQCHFFAGLGGWSGALRLAGVPDNRPLWTGSCPCQPFSSAGKRKGFSDERHLWPEWFRLIGERRPPIIFGEQVARASVWLDAVFADMEAEGYACGAAVLPAASVNAPHRRDRIWFVADANGERQPRGPQPNLSSIEPAQQAPRRSDTMRFCGDVPNPISGELRQQPRRGGRASGADQAIPFLDGEHGHVADAESERRQPRPRISEPMGARTEPAIELEGRTSLSPEAGRRANNWTFEPAVGRVAHGIPARVAKLRALGNAIVPQVAAAFITAALSHSQPYNTRIDDGCP